MSKKREHVAKSDFDILNDFFIDDSKKYLIIQCEISKNITIKNYINCIFIYFIKVFYISLKTFLIKYNNEHFLKLSEYKKRIFLMHIINNLFGPHVDAKYEEERETRSKGQSDENILYIDKPGVRFNTRFNKHNPKAPIYTKIKAKSLRIIYINHSIYKSVDFI